MGDGTVEKPEQSTRQALLCGVSIEVTPGDKRGILAAGALLRPGSRVYIASVGHHGNEETIATAEQLRKLGLTPVPHIAARRLKSFSELRCLLEELAPLTREALVIGGDVKEPAGPFDSALAVLRSGLVGPRNLHRIGLAGYPEGHPSIAEAVLDRSLLDKIGEARKIGLDPYIVSQFCFDAGVICMWERRMRQVVSGKVDIHIGIPGVTALGKLLRFAMLCGTGASIRFLRQHAGQVSRLMQPWRPDALVRELCEAVAADPDCSISQFHFFPFGGLDTTLRWLEAAQNGFLEPQNGRG